MRLLRREEKEVIFSQVKALNQARKVLRDWLGDGGQPVPLAEAQARADICAGCPHNCSDQWLWSKSTAFMIARQLQLRSMMSIKIEHEEKLHICDVCGCQIRLKIHAPFKHIYRHTPDSQFEKYPDFCWQKIELRKIKP